MVYSSVLTFGFPQLIGSLFQIQLKRLSRRALQPGMFAADRFEMCLPHVISSVDSFGS